MLMTAADTLHVPESALLCTSFLGPKVKGPEEENLVFIECLSNSKKSALHPGDSAKYLGRDHRRGRKWGPS